MARKPAKATSWVASAAASPLTRKIESGRSGVLLRRALITKAASSTNAPASSAIVSGAPQPWSGAFTRVNTSSSIPPVARIVPTTPKSASRPPGAGGQQAAEEHTGGRSEPANPTPDSERRVAVRPLPERRREDRERGRERHGGAQAPGE